MKLCIDCKFYSPVTGGIWPFRFEYPELAKCSETLDPVNGKAEKFCEFKRKPNGSCGPDGKLFQPKGLS